MRNSKFVVSAALAISAVVGAASAADLPAGAYTKAPVAVVPVTSWTGCYAGGNIGGGWAHSRADDTAPGGGGLTDIASNTATGVVGGGQIGCDLQFGNWVVGARGLFDGANIAGSSPLSSAAVASGNWSPTERFGFKTSWFGTLTGRVGYAVQPQWLIYLDGGAAWTRNQYTDSDTSNFFGAPFSGSATATRAGWTVGAGLEYKFLENWSVFAEYDFIELGGRNVSIVYGPTTAGIENPYSYHAVQNFQTVLFGVNYRFGGPVVAKY
jgi:outer membrane immunogenic protein